jgi:hypothetical protein
MCAAAYGGTALPLQSTRLVATFDQSLVNRPLDHAMRIRSRTILVMLGCLLALFVTFFVLRARWQRQVAEAKSFCENLVPMIDRSRAQTGSYPKQADSSWWVGRSVPALIRTQDFYLSTDGSRFLLRFRDPAPAMDDIWGFDSRAMGWLNYDGY